MTAIYIIKATTPNKEAFEKKIESPSLANYYFDKCIADGYANIEVCDIVTGKPFQKYTITEDEEGNAVESIWTEKEFDNLL